MSKTVEGTEVKIYQLAPHIIEDLKSKGVEFDWFMSFSQRKLAAEFLAEKREWIRENKTKVEEKQRLLKRLAKTEDFLLTLIARLESDGQADESTSQGLTRDCAMLFRGVRTALDA
jgi:predicted metal-dependent hydrolase